MDGSSAAEVARASGLPLAELRPGLWSREDLVELQLTLLRRELGVPDDRCSSPDELLPLLLAVRDRLDRRIAAVRAASAGHASTPAEILDGFGEPPELDETLDELGLAWARLWSTGESVDSPAARRLADRHRELVGPGVGEALGALLDRHALGVAAYARDALAVTG